MAAVACTFARLTDSKAERPSFGELSLQYGMREDELAAAVRRLRARPTDEPCARGSLVAPRARSRAAEPTGTSYHAAAS